MQFLVCTRTFRLLFVAAQTRITETETETVMVKLERWWVCYMSFLFLFASIFFFSFVVCLYFGLILLFMCTMYIPIQSTILDLLSFAHTLCWLLVVGCFASHIAGCYYYCSSLIPQAFKHVFVNDGCWPKTPNWCKHQIVRCTKLSTNCIWHRIQCYKIVRLSEMVFRVFVFHMCA